VRELENTIERAIVLGTTDWILPEDLPEAVLETKAMIEGSVATYHQDIIQHKKQLILHAVEQAKNNHAEAARLLGVHPNYLQRLMTNLNLSSAAKM
jgi:DNA-binding NtrC family response regulator